MANEYAVNQADLTIVADAIREKGKTSEQLVFPSGFVEAIENMKGGGDLNFEIVGGETEPESPVENTIWIKTGISISGFVFGQTENIPTSPANGMVWISTSDTGAVLLNALKEDYLYLKLVYASQYQNGAWARIDTVKIFQGGKWVDFWDYFYFKPGNMYEGITGGWNRSNATVTSESISLTAPNTANWDAYACTAQSVNLRGIDTLYFKVVSIYSYLSQWVKVCVRSEPNGGGVELNSCSFYSAQEVALDVRDIDDGYITIQAGNISKVTIESIRCE